MKMTLLALLATLTFGMGAAFAQTSHFQTGTRHHGTVYQYDIPGG